MKTVDTPVGAAAVAARFEEITDARHVDLLDTICAPDMINHSLAADRSPGLRGTREYLSSPLADRFAGETWRERTVVSDGEFVVHHGIRTGRWPGGEFFGIHADAGDYEREVVFMYRVRGDRVIERWAIRDDLGFLRQLGALRPTLGETMTTHVTPTDSARAQVRDLWQHMAPGWERRRDFLSYFSGQITNWLVDRLDPRPGDTILELAAGPGDTGFAARSRIEAGHLITSDFAPEMVAVARRRARELGIAGTEFAVLDAEHLDLPTDSINGVICRWGYSLMLDPRTALAETRRVLRPGGRLALSVMSTPQANPWGSRLMGSIVSLGLIPPPDPKHPGGLFSLADHEDLRRLLTAVGFHEPEIEDMPFTLRFADFEDYWQFILEFAGGVSTLLDNLEEHQRAAVREATRHAIAEFAAGAAYEFPGLTVNAVCH